VSCSILDRDSPAPDNILRELVHLKLFEFSKIYWIYNIPETEKKSPYLSKYEIPPNTCNKHEAVPYRYTPIVVVNMRGGMFSHFENNKTRYMEMNTSFSKV
jgi:hypothetical protein